jgi:ABC-type lipoprotein export system ATPase subunit/GNAT superfamily N-acetyltransferase
MKVIKLQHEIIKDEYTKYVCESFDIQDSKSTIVEIPINLDDCKSFEWNIGVIYGNSGCGKSTILNHFGSVQDPQFNHNKSLISNFDFISPKDACFLLSSMGLSSVPTWLRPYRLLSNGEQYRAKLAYVVGISKENEIILVDEFTSVVDRNVAKAMSYSLQKYVRKNNKKIILASCHFDIMEWLMPDWTYSPLKERVERHEYLRQGRPKINLQVSRCESKTYDLFKKHHYMTQSVNKAFKFILFEWNDKPIAIAVIGMQTGRGVGNAYRDSRIVVLPDYQGLGIGTSVSNFIGAICKNIGYRYFTKTIHPALGEYRNYHTKIWRATAYNDKIRNDKDSSGNKWKILLRRKSYCHEYIGDAIDGYDELLRSIDIMRDLKQYKLL